VTDFGDDFRICSWNIHKGFGPANRRFTLEDMREAIRSVDADICFLQEVVGHQLGYHGRDLDGTESQFEFMADKLWHHYAYGKNAIIEDGHHGNAILSKFPFAEWRNHDITRWSFSSRGLLFGHLENGVVLVCAHLGLLAAERRYQVRRLRDLLESECDPDVPVIVAGDFNDWRMQVDKVMCGELGFSEVIREQDGVPARSFPAALPLLQMDRIYFRGLDLLSARVLRGGVWSRLSDHAALTAHFRMP
jgi:endonuclease/exonuclease/phosphatase family metal-dependent hydrolase